MNAWNSPFWWRSTRAICVTSPSLQGKIIEKPEAVCINRVGFRRNMGDATEFLVLPESFKAEVCKGHNAKRAAAVLLTKGLLVPGEGRNLMRRSPVDLPGYGRKRCYTILINGGWQDVAE
jgi:hypothetical protein